MIRSGFCTICNDPTEGTDWHHALHKGRGGSDHDHNLLELDRRCHSAHHDAQFTIDQPSFAKGWRWLPGHSVNGAAWCLGDHQMNKVSY